MIPSSAARAFSAFNSALLAPFSARAKMSLRIEAEFRQQIGYRRAIADRQAFAEFRCVNRRENPPAPRLRARAQRAPQAGFLRKRLGPPERQPSAPQIRSMSRHMYRPFAGYMLKGESRQPFAAKIGPSRNGRQVEFDGARLGERSRSHRRRVGVGAGELVPEFRRRHRALPFRPQVWHGAERRAKSVEPGKRKPPRRNGAARFLTCLSLADQLVGARPGPAHAGVFIFLLAHVLLVLGGFRHRLGMRHCVGPQARRRERPGWSCRSGRRRREARRRARR